VTLDRLCQLVELWQQRLNESWAHLGPKPGLLTANSGVLVCPTGGTARTVCQLKALQQIHILSNQCLAGGGRGGRWCQVSEVLLGAFGVIEEIKSSCGGREHPISHRASAYGDAKDVQLISRYV